ncbi:MULTISPECIES: hypothetical protein [unclassified Okeania]|uniref:hypothetical protein n=1 Tax=unclassified Okeania TaxID=2634635 RepID=UPI0013B8B8E6|nr:MULTISPECIES: hypothetical protein [unclassified Okeania]NET18562.1 hypothetical protein [Okeania sp. SIO1H5]NET94905.1 hypothetical protein [Okeania sp. SIO1H2]
MLRKRAKLTADCSFKLDSNGHLKQSFDLFKLKHTFEIIAKGRKKEEGRRQKSYQIRLNSHRMVKLGVLRSQETVLRRRKNYKDEGSYDD